MHPWPRYFIKNIYDSKEFNYKIEKFNYKLKVIKKHKHSTYFAVEDKVILLDTWDSLVSLRGLNSLNYFTDPPPDFRKVDLILRVQYNDYCKKFSEIIKIPISPFLIMPNIQFPLGFFKWKETNKFKHDLFFTGSLRDNVRREWWEYFENNNIFNSSSLLHFQDYLALTKDSKWGLIINGGGKITDIVNGYDGKNRREAEYLSCGMPLVLNYKPNYPFEYLPDVHYVYVEKPEDLNKLKDLDPKPFAEKSVEIYEKYYTPSGMANLFKEIVKRELGI
jgi:hypothetical protein